MAAEERNGAFFSDADAREQSNNGMKSGCSIPILAELSDETHAIVNGSLVVSTLKA